LLFVVVISGQLSCCKREDPVDKDRTALPAFDDLWNYDEPAVTERKFRELLARVQGAAPTEYIGELRTQVARSQGLQQKYADALATLDAVDAELTPRMTTVRVRSLLERGRVLNSSGKAAESVPLFDESLRVAESAGLEYYAVDAAHMLGIATKDAISLEWNRRAIELAEGARDPKAHRWLGPLYNNTGWTYFDMRRYSDALAMFERDLVYRKTNGTKVQIGNARWAVAKVLRHLGRVEESLKLQLELLDDADRKGKDSEGYTHEEIGECLLLLHRDSEATGHFVRAWELLHNDPWLKQDEPARLARLKKLAKLY
jgi:tetratricopeptide (TPR) repeat protein